MSVWMLALSPFSEAMAAAFRFVFEEQHLVMQARQHRVHALLGALQGGVEFIVALAGVAQLLAALVPQIRRGDLLVLILPFGRTNLRRPSPPP